MTEHPGNLRDRTFVVLGAGGGIGSATFGMLAARGARLVAGGRDAGRLIEVAATAESPNDPAEPPDLSRRRLDRWGNVREVSRSLSY